MKISEICEKLKLEFKGEDKEISSLNSLEFANEKQMSFLQGEKFKNLAQSTKAAALIISKDMANLIQGKTLILSENPYLDFARITYFFKKPNLPTYKEKPQISSQAYVAKTAVIANGSSVDEKSIINEGVVIGQNVTIGKNCIIHPNVVIYDDTIIEDRCIIQANSVIGSDGFGYAHTNLGEHIKIYHNGNVVLQSDVEIGSNTSIDRAVFGSTIIKKGSKIDNLVQIGHNCELGENCIIVSQVGLSGSSILGRNVVMGGQSATSGHITIGDFAQIAARGGVSKSLDGGKTYGGFPILLQKDWLKLQARILKFFKNKE